VLCVGLRGKHDQCEWHLFLTSFGKEERKNEVICKRERAKFGQDVQRQSMGQTKAFFRALSLPFGVQTFPNRETFSIDRQFFSDGSFEIYFKFALFEEVEIIPLVESSTVIFKISRCATKSAANFPHQNSSEQLAHELSTVSDVFYSMLTWESDQVTWDTILEKAVTKMIIEHNQKAQKMSRKRVVNPSRDDPTFELLLPVH